jgi:cob(I)alamin adenosyltransferase
VKRKREHKGAGGQETGAGERGLSTSGPNDEMAFCREPGKDRDPEAPGSRPPAPGPRFEDPRLAINRVYTKRGDAGETSLAGGQRIPKDAARIEAYGAVDELNAFVGAARASLETLAASNPGLARLAATLLRVQHELFNLGSILATLPEDVHPRQPRITETEIAQLEKEMDEMNAELPPLRSFVLPGGCRMDAELHICRTVCRRAERRLIALAREAAVPPETVKYLNRLGDALFVWARWASRASGAKETLWEPNQSASGRSSG